MPFFPKVYTSLQPKEKQPEKCRPQGGHQRKDPANPQPQSKGKGIAGQKRDEFRVRTARSKSRDDPTELEGSKWGSVHERLVYPKDHHLYKQIKASGEGRKQCSIARAEEDVGEP